MECIYQYTKQLEVFETLYRQVKVVENILREEIKILKIEKKVDKEYTDKLKKERDRFLIEIKTYDPGYIVGLEDR